MAITQKQLAERLNVSQSTVAKVLGNRNTAWVSEETRRKVLDLARETGYRPHAGGRSLSLGVTNALALVYRRPHADASAAYVPIIEAMAELLGAQSYHLIVRVAPDQESVLETLDELATSRSCDAIMLWGAEEEVQEQGNLLEKRGIPFAAKGRFENNHPRWPQIDYDHEGMMREAVRHMAALGHRRIAFFTHDNDFAYTRALRRGFLDAMRDRLNGRVPERHIFAIDNSSACNPALVNRLDEWFAARPGSAPTAIVMGAGGAIFQFLELELLRRGVRMGENPGEMPVVAVEAPCASLMVARTRVFSNIGYHHLAEATATRLLLPLLAGTPIAQPIVRLVPELLELNGSLLGYSDLFSIRSM